MALTATICKALLQIADMDRGHYGDHAITIARHPSETEERMMVRVLVFALHADEGLQFTKGLCADDEPDLWAKDLTGEVDLWIDVGLPDERRLKKACTRSRQVIVYAYGGRAAPQWWERTGPAVERFDNLRVVNLSYEATKALATLAGRNMSLQCTVQEGQVWIGNGRETVMLELEHWLGQ